MSCGKLHLSVNSHSIYQLLDMALTGGISAVIRTEIRENTMSKPQELLLILLYLYFAFFFFKLPSDSFKYLGWCDIEGHGVRGNQLHCPRVREGKGQKDTLTFQP